MSSSVVALRFAVVCISHHLENSRGPPFYNLRCVAAGLVAAGPGRPQGLRFFSRRPRGAALEGCQSGAQVVNASTIESADLRSGSRDFREEAPAAPAALKDVGPRKQRRSSVNSRRDFIRTSAALGIGGFSATRLLEALAGQPVEATQASAARAAAQPLDLAEWSYFWIGVEQAHLARGTTVNGKQMYVEYWIPSLVRHPLPIVLVHGGGGQGLDWMGTPDGRPGWVTHLLQEGFKVYVVDRPGHGRSPFHPDLHGPFPPQTNTLESMSGQFTPPNASRPASGPYRPLHNQWPGTGEIGSPDLDQLVASQGGSYVATGGTVSPGAAAPA